MITIHVLSNGELFQTVLNAMASFVTLDSFEGLIKITTLVGIIMATVGYFKTRDPMAFVRWFLVYMLAFNIALLPKTDVLIHDLSEQTDVDFKVDNVPVVFALSASLMTTIGYGLAQTFDSLFSMPDDFQYHQTGVLFGSKMIQASKDFRILDPDLKSEMNAYFRNCVVGDIRINHKYSVLDLSTSTNIWDLTARQASPLRMTPVNGKIVTCKTAASSEGKYSLKAKLDKEINNAYKIYGIQLFNKQSSNYEDLFNRYLKSAATYYQGMTDEASNIFLQSMMINAMGDGVRHYQAFTDSTAGVANQQFTKSQVQHRWAWQVAGMKAAWFLPILHTDLTVMLFAIFPLVLALTTLPIGARIMQGYLQFFLSLQLWPVFFAVLNLCMTKYGVSQSRGYGHFTMVNFDKIDELHSDIAGVAGYMMMLIPFLANGLLTRFSDSFNSLATSMTSHMQSSTMAVAGEAASGSFSIGQTSFYNTNANNLSANKHDSNYTNLHGLRTEQMESGVLKTLTGRGDAIFDGTPGMSRGAISINGSSSMVGSLNQAYEQSTNVAANESQQYQTSLSNAAHRMMQLSNMSGHDMRFGEGVSSSETSQFNEALSTMKNIATDVAHRTGMSTDEAFAAMTSGGGSLHAGISTDRGVFGKALKWTTGIKGSADAHLKYDRSSTSSNRYNEGFDNAVSAKEASDFNNAFSVAQSFVQGHHFDDTHSEAAQLSNQLGTDLRDAQTASHNYDVAMSRANRISDAKSFVESHSEQINTDFNQAFPAYVKSQVGESQRDSLFSNPGDTQALHQLEGMADDFVASRRDQLIEQFGNHSDGNKLNSFYSQESSGVASHQHQLGTNFKDNSDSLKQHAQTQSLGINQSEKNAFVQAHQNNVDATKNEISTGQHHMDTKMSKQKLTSDQVKDQMKVGEYDAKTGVIIDSGLTRAFKPNNLKNKE